MRDLSKKLKWAAQQRPSGVGRTLLFFATVVFSLTWLYHHSTPTFAGVVIAGLACGLWALFFEPRRLIRRHFVHTVQELKPNQHIRLAVLGDLHVGALHFGETELKQLITRIQQEDVQAVLLLGDYVIQRMPGGRPVAIERTAELLAELKVPIVAIVGNHDIWEGRDQIKDALRHASIVVLDNQHHILRLRDVELCIVGLDDESTGKPNPQIAFPATPPTAPIIVLAHDPSTFKRTMPHTGSLLLSGHTHGGQIRIPGLGALVIPSHAPLSWALGWTLTASGPLYVTSGLGTSVVPLRFCCPPEYVIMDLQPATSDA